jgi:hypothetical protein
MLEGGKKFEVEVLRGTPFHDELARRLGLRGRDART